MEKLSDKIIDANKQIEAAQNLESESEADSDSSQEESKTESNQLGVTPAPSKKSVKANEYKAKKLSLTIVNAVKKVHKNVQS